MGKRVVNSIHRDWQKKRPKVRIRSGISPLLLDIVRFRKHILSSCPRVCGVGGRGEDN